MHSVITASHVASLVLRHWISNKQAAITTQELHDSHFKGLASISSVRKAINEAADEQLIVDISHHAGRRVWTPSRKAILSHITELESRIKFLTEK